MPSRGTYALNLNDSYVKTWECLSKTLRTFLIASYLATSWESCQASDKRFILTHLLAYL